MAGIINQKRIVRLYPAGQGPEFGIDALGRGIRIVEFYEALGLKAVALQQDFFHLLGVIDRGGQFGEVNIFVDADDNKPEITALGLCCALSADNVYPAIVLFVFRGILGKSDKDQGQKHWYAVEIEFSIHFYSPPKSVISSVIWSRPVRDRPSKTDGRNT